MNYFIDIYFISGNHETIEVTEQQFRRYRNMFHDVSQDAAKELPRIMKIKNNYYNTQHIEFIEFGDIQKG